MTHHGRKTIRRMQRFLGKRLMAWFKVNNYAMYLQFAREADHDPKQWRFNARQLVTRICRDTIIRDGDHPAPAPPACPKTLKQRPDPGVQ